MKSEYEQSLQDSGLNAESLGYIEYLYRLSLETSKAHSEYLQSLLPDQEQTSNEKLIEKSHAHTRALFSQFNVTGLTNPQYATAQKIDANQEVYQWIDNHRRLGHYRAQCGVFTPMPQSIQYAQVLDKIPDQKKWQNEINIGTNSFNNIDDLGQYLAKTYCSTIGYEYMHIDAIQERSWWQEQVEDNAGFCHSAQREQVLDWLTQAHELEVYLGRKFVGQKRFSLEGAESLIAALAHLLETVSKQGCDDVVVGMAHRGRLNVLVNLLGMSCADLDKKFCAAKASQKTSGDVKYHLGYSSNRVIAGKRMHVALAYNPSHLEVITPVILGNVRARNDYAKNRGSEQRSLAVHIHGDAAIAGQGVIAESINLSCTEAYTVQGSIHIVINNQIGFTTDPVDSRSSVYCTDIAKLIQAPVLHVNAENIDALLNCIELACAYREKFNKDVFIDMVCYRRHGHNEADEASATHPLLYKQIRERENVAIKYASKLTGQSLLSPDYYPQKQAQVQAKIKSGANLVEVDSANEFTSERQKNWQEYQSENWRDGADTTKKQAHLQDLAARILQLPSGFSLQPQVQKMHEDRQSMCAGDKPINWGCAEMLAYGSLLEEGVSIRLIGQDTCRGTFAHRHAVYRDQNSGKAWVPLAQVEHKTSTFHVYNSVLSECAALAFEYGYAESSPNSLVIWEAQFGDFANNAQTVIDQFITSGWQKWQRMCGLVLLLPHGIEGQGPEHSSARLERFLQMCAQDNIQVCVPSLPAQLFHLLRRQVIRAYRRPLVVLTPKSLLRHPKVQSKLGDFAQGVFKVVIENTTSTACAASSRLVICSGKVYYDLEKRRAQESLNGVHIIRLEQLYPFPYTELSAVLGKYQHLKEIHYCQEEPLNQGAWYALNHRVKSCLQTKQHLCFIGRPKMASPASGDLHLYKCEQELLIEQALGLRKLEEGS